MWYAGLVERGLVPDAALRAGIRRLLAARLHEKRVGNAAFVGEMRRSPIAVSTPEANEQHYEVPPEFFRLVLGRHLKYSACLWEAGTSRLDGAEKAMLAMTCERARLADGLDILELGCGWGSLSLFMAARYPNARVTAVSNSKDQRLHIEAEAKRLGLSNLGVITADMNTFEAPRAFDRVVSVEMFEHMRNWERLLGNVARWMKPDARLFIHVFSHREVAYFFEDRDDSDWMARNFFTGGLMPSDRLIYEFRKDVAVEEHWQLNGVHYRKTSEAWLANLDRERKPVTKLFEETYGKNEARRRFVAWRLFFMACAECFGYKDGNEWLVSHYLLRKQHD